jgi:hypothetical protein
MSASQTPLGHRRPRLRRWFAGLFTLWAVGVATSAQGPNGSWWDPGRAEVMPASASYDNPAGQIGILNTGGPVATKGHPFFEPIGTNGRACVTCHQPSNGMSLSAAAARERWTATGGKDPLFAAIDGSNCPSLPQQLEPSHSLLINRGLIRVALPWPPVDAHGAAIVPEFAIEVVRDPTTCNADPTYGLKSARPTVSVFRRPRVVANLKYVATFSGPFNIKTGALMDVDPESGTPVGMNIMADAREPTLATQAKSAGRDHLQVRTPLSYEQIQRIVEFEEQIYSAQRASAVAGSLVEREGPDGLGPEVMARSERGLGDNVHTPVFGFFDMWKPKGPEPLDARRAFRASVARGSDVFFLRPFWIRDATHINSIGLGNPLKRTCATCHNSLLVGMDAAPGYVDLGTTNYPRWTESALSIDTKTPELPVFKITCQPTAPPHPYLGRVIYTTDPGRALISGKCTDVGAIVMQQFRGLAARAPYFSNGAAKTLRELVDYYDRRFDAKYTEQEKQDLVNFLSVL